MNFTTYRVFFRVPATEKHGSFLSDAVVMASSQEGAKAKVLALHPDYIISSVMVGK